MWNHVYNNFTLYGNKSGIACSSDSIVCTECCGEVYQILYDIFIWSSYCKKTYRMGPCVAGVAFAFQAFPVIVRDADSFFSTRKVFRFTSILFSYTIRKREEKMCDKWPERFLVLNSANSSFSSFIVKQETIILPLDNNDIMNCGMIQKKRGLHIWWKSSFTEITTSSKTCQYHNDVKT